MIRPGNGPASARATSRHIEWTVIMPPTRWTPAHIAVLDTTGAPAAPVITAADVVPVAPGMGFWDAWPVQGVDGAVYRWRDEVELWLALGTPLFDDPDDRHAHARIHLIRRRGDDWRHVGPAMPDGFSPGSREWSGTAVIDDAGQTVTLYFTAAGRRGEATPSFEQRLFSATATLADDGGAPTLSDWRDLREVVERDPAHYMTTTGDAGRIGTIKGFRDPAFFRDPADGARYLFFTGSAAGSASAYNGVIGVARAVGDAWRTLPPIVTAEGLNNELERPHVVHHDGLYYLFWVTQRHVFDPAGPTGPTGLYGMVSASLSGGWEPINGSGLVVANPAGAPAQAYSWFVFPDLSVTSFVDDWGDGGTRRFGGTFAPFLHLRLDGGTATLRADSNGKGDTQ